MNIRLLAADMDGTLLNDNYQLSERTAKAIRAWADSGRYFVPSTGRPMCAMDSIIKLFPEDMPFVVYNGAMAVMHRSKELLYSITIQAETALEIWKLGNEKNLPAAAWANDALFANKDCKEIRFYQEATNAPAKFVDDLTEVARQGITKILWFDEPANVLVHQKEMQAHFGRRINCHGTRPELFEFVDPSASKADALETVRQKLGVTREEMAAVGDGYNDLSMLRYAGYSIAMGNAPKDIQAECSHVTLTNNEDGVAVWIEEILRNDV